MKSTKNIIVKEVVSAKEKRAFACFNADFYADNPNAIPDIVSDEYDTFIPKKNPAYEFCETIQFLAYYEGEKNPVGRIAGIINKAANEKWERNDRRSIESYEKEKNRSLSAFVKFS